MQVHLYPPLSVEMHDQFREQKSPQFNDCLHSSHHYHYSRFLFHNHKPLVQWKPESHGADKYLKGQLSPMPPTQ